MSTARILYLGTQVLLTGLKVCSDVMFIQAAYNNDTEDDTLRNLFVINKAADIAFMTANICSDGRESLISVVEGFRVLKGIGEVVAYSVLGSAAAKGCAIATATYDGSVGLLNSIFSVRSCKPEPKQEAQMTRSAAPRLGYVPPEVV